jgi:hypothetical protein
LCFQFSENIPLAKQVLSRLWVPTAMTVLEALTQSECYRVEVSGWDENQVFFLEKSDLAWDDFAGKHISLQRMLPDGAMVFIRMLQPQSLGQSPPIVYEVEFIGCDPDGHHQFRLKEVQPRYSHSLAPVN